MKVRISKNGKFAKQFPIDVANRIREIASTYSDLGSVTIEDCDQTKQFLVSEGDKYTGIKSDGQEVGFNVVSQDTIGAANVSYYIGSKFNMPEESYLIKTERFCGRCFMTVYRIGRNENITIEQVSSPLKPLTQSEVYSPKIIDTPYKYVGFKHYIFIDDTGEYFVRQETMQGLVDTPIHKFYTRNFAIAYLSYNGIMRNNIDDNLFTELYLMCDGFGKIDYKEANDICFDWSHVRDASLEAFEMVCDRITEVKQYYGGFEMMIELYKSKIADALFNNKRIVSDTIIGEINLGY